MRVVDSNGKRLLLRGRAKRTRKGGRHVRYVSHLSRRKAVGELRRETSQNAEGVGARGCQSRECSNAGSNQEAQRAPARIVVVLHRADLQQLRAFERHSSRALREET